MGKKNNEPENEDVSKKIKENVDLIVSVGGILLGIFIIYMSVVYEIHQQDIGGTIFLASALYILLRKRLLKSSEAFHFKPTRKFIYINNIIFFLALSLSVWILYIILYYRPVIYFILVAVACASIALEILYSNRKWACLILIKILLIGITLYGGLYYEFEDIYGADPHYHNAQTTFWMEKGHIAPDPPLGSGLNQYYYFPIFHILAASTSILTSLNVYDSIFSLISFLFVFSVIFVFLIGRKLINPKTSLLAALILVFCDYRITFGAEPNPMTLGVVFFTIILYLVIVNTPRAVYKRIMAFVLSIIIILTHTIAGFVTFVTLTSLIICKNINKHLTNINSNKFTIFWSTSIAFGVILLGYWAYALRDPAESPVTFFGFIIYSLHKGLTYDAEFATGTTEKVSPYLASSYFEYVLDHLGYLILLGFGIIGVYIWLRKRYDNYKISLALTMVVLLAVLYGFSLLGLRNILSTRWFVFVYVILALVSAYGIFKLANLINKKSGKVIVVITIFLMSFFMITSTISNDDNPLYHKEHSYRMGHKASELQGILTIHQIFNRTFEISESYLTFNIPCATLNSDVISPDYNFSEDEGKLYVLKKDAFKYPMVLKKIRHGVYAPFILEDELRIRLESNGNEIYDNGEVWGYLIKEKDNNGS